MYIATMGTTMSANGSTTKLVIVKLKTIFAYGPKLLRREKHLKIILNF
jgi:hypothetical protein